MSRPAAIQAAEASLDRNGIPGWYNPVDLGELTWLARQARDVEGVCVEYGSYQGRSSVAIARVLQRHLVCVDPWLDVPGSLSGDECYAAFCRHTRAHAIHGHRLGWRDWLEQTEPYGIRYAFCHVDAEHTYDEVAETIRRMFPLTEPGGILCGHDYGWPDGSHAGVTRAVDELIPERRVVGSVWSVRRQP